MLQVFKQNSIEIFHLQSKKGYFCFGFLFFKFRKHEFGFYQYEQRSKSCIHGIHYKLLILKDIEELSENHFLVCKIFKIDSNVLFEFIKIKLRTTCFLLELTVYHCLFFF